MSTSVGDPFTWIVYLTGPSNASICNNMDGNIKILLTAITIFAFFKLWKISSISK